MTVQEPIIKNGYLAWMDGYCTAQQALRSGTYIDPARCRVARTRAQLTAG